MSCCPGTKCLLMNKYCGGSKTEYKGIKVERHSGEKQKCTELLFLQKTKRQQPLKSGKINLTDPQKWIKIKTKNNSANKTKS